nr:DUF4835 family protein [Bacteroidota bacterium]
MNINIDSATIYHRSIQSIDKFANLTDQFTKTRAYPSMMVNIKDDYFEFRFVEFQQLEYNENAQNSNLVSVLATVNIILGFRLRFVFNDGWQHLL